MQKDNIPVSASLEKKTIPTYIPKEAIKLPMFYEKRQYQGASGKIYPLPATDSFSDVKEDREWTVGVLENEYIYCEILPEIGGKIKRAYDKQHKYDFVYHNSIIKPAGIGIAGPWISGGIEFNWPQHHRPTTFMSVEATVKEGEDGSKTIYVGEVEPLYKTKGMVGITLREGRTYISANARLYNDTEFAQPFMWWANLASPAVEGYRIVFPEDVEYVLDHDRKAVMSWPIAKGKYGEGRGYDFGDATDISYFRNIKPQSSYMVPFGMSNLDYISGYDENLNLGIVSVSDHQIAPAKKLFTWGVSEFGDMWCMNLTDDDGPYIEIMTGAYTDNQPDFSWIAPYETKEFTQYWYPINDIGLVKNATIDAAINLEVRQQKLFLGINVTGSFSDCNIEVRSKNKVIYSDTVDLTPEAAYIRDIEHVEFDESDLMASVTDNTGTVLVDYMRTERGNKTRPEPRSQAKKPEEIETVDELYINGLHLVQYRHHSFVPEHYFLEGLRRDPGDVRCNTAMGKLLLMKGNLKAALEYFDAAIKRLTSRNETPYDTEVFYYRGITLAYLNRMDEAYDSMYKAVWQYSYRSSGYYELAEIDSARLNYQKAIRHLDLSLETNTKHTKALLLKSRMLSMVGKRVESEQILQEVLVEDPLSIHAKSELWLLGFDESQESELSLLLKSKPDYAIGLASVYMKTGFIDDSIKVLSFAKQSPLACYYLSFCYAKKGESDKAIEWSLAAEKADSSYCFPSRISDIEVLVHASNLIPDGYLADYLLGCYYTHNERYDEAISCFERSMSSNGEFAYTLRNLALLYFNKKQNRALAKALMEKALRLDNDPRMFYEYQQLLKNMGYSADYRLAVYDEYCHCSDLRDDSFVEKLLLLGISGRYSEVLELAAARQFHVYEGGEGRLSRLYCWMNICEGYSKLRDKEPLAAVDEFMKALTIPKNFAEARSVFEDISYIYYNIGYAKELAGDSLSAAEYYTLATEDKGVISEVSFWRALALTKLGEGAKATQLLHQMYEEGELLLAKKDEYGYFGGGSPTPQPFEDDIRKKNTVLALTFKMYSCYGLGQYIEAEAFEKKLNVLEPVSLSLYIFKNLVKSSLPSVL